MIKLSKHGADTWVRETGEDRAYKSSKRYKRTLESSQQLSFIFFIFIFTNEWTTKPAFSAREEQEHAYRACISIIRRDRSPFTSPNHDSTICRLNSPRSCSRTPRRDGRSIRAPSAFAALWLEPRRADGASAPMDKARELFPHSQRGIVFNYEIVIETPRDRCAFVFIARKESLPCDRSTHARYCLQSWSFELIYDGWYATGS